MMTIFAVMVAVVSIWEYPQTLAKRPQVANRFDMVATTCDEEEPASVPAKGIAGHPLVLSGRNVGWDRAAGCFAAKIELKDGPDGNSGDLYVNRDGKHSAINCEEFPGLTPVAFDQEAQSHQVHMCFPNMLFPYPTFGNSSLSFQNSPMWRSLPRAMMTGCRGLLPLMEKLYLSNQVWVYPSAGDTPPVGTNGDVFASIAPYWLTTAGRSWSDLPYLKAALEASRSLDPDVKREIVRRGLLAPTVQTLIRKSLKGVATEADYLTPAAHPTALPPDGLDLQRLVGNAEALTAKAIPPLAKIKLESVKILGESRAEGELTYATDYACAVVLRSKDRARVFRITALGDDEYEFFQSHGDTRGVKIERLLNVAAVSIDRQTLSPTNRIDIAVVGKTAKSGWGAPSYVSFAVLDENAPYCDPTLVLKPVR